jgi:photosystem II stability/assembly factor-like uncharacterized protein
MKQIAIGCCVLMLVLLSGCSKEPTGTTHADIPPKTYLWLFPDSSIAEGPSKQHIRWWGDDPDGRVIGYLFTSGKFSLSQSHNPVLDTIAWRWVTTNDTLIAFPLLVKRDTFGIVVRAVDNSFLTKLPERALIRLASSPGSSSSVPYYDVNENGAYDAGDIAIPGLFNAMDLKGASLDFPLLNRPPSVVFAQNPNDPTIQIQQPDTTYTAATFSWVGSDPDGDQTIKTYEIVLNDTTNPQNIFIVPGNVRLVTLLVPRSRSDSVAGIQPVPADVWAGTFSTTRRFLGSMPNLRLDTLNIFYVRARDIAGDVSGFAALPGDVSHRWFVKNPHGRVLIISDYISFDKKYVIPYYQSVFNALGYGNVEVLDIALGITPTQKQNLKFGKLVPPFLDPAFTSTLQLFDLVYWYTDQFPSLAVAQVPLYQYLHDATRVGKVIFSTMFATATDPRGALTDFSPLDSVSTVYLANNRALPAFGETAIPTTYQLVPDSSDPADLYPPLQFGNTAPGFTQFQFYPVFMRSVYRRADARYIYHIQKDVQKPVSYSYVTTLNDLNGAAARGSSVWMCGAGGLLITSDDDGQSWQTRTLPVTDNLEAVHFTDASVGVIVGDNGAFFLTSDGGATWQNKSFVTEENLMDAYFFNQSNGYIVGTNGHLIHTTNSGASWKSSNLPTANTLRSISFSDPLTGIAVGDNGYIVKTTNGGVNWNAVLSLTTARLCQVIFHTPAVAFASGANGVILRSTDAGDTWTTIPTGSGETFRTITFTTPTAGYACGTNGIIDTTVDGGLTWGTQYPILSQTLTMAAFQNPQSGWIAATNGVILHTSDGAMTWEFQPNGNINIGVIDGPGLDGKHGFVFLGLPLHYLDGPGGPGGTVIPFLRHVIQDEFGY